MFNVIEFKFDTPFCGKRNNDGRQNPILECNIEEERGRLRNMHILMDASLAMGSRNTM